MASSKLPTDGNPWYDNKRQQRDMEYKKDYPTLSKQAELHEQGTLFAWMHTTNIETLKKELANFKEEAARSKAYVDGQYKQERIYLDAISAMWPQMEVKLAGGDGTAEKRDLMAATKAMIGMQEKVRAVKLKNHDKQVRQYELRAQAMSLMIKHKEDLAAGITSNPVLEDEIDKLGKEAIEVGFAQRVLQAEEDDLRKQQTPVDAKLYSKIHGEEKD